MMASRALLAPKRITAAQTRLFSSSSTPVPSASQDTKKPDERKIERKVKKEKWLPYILSMFGVGSIEGVDGERIKVKDIRLPHAVEAATGDYKLYLLAFEQGFIDPYCTLPIERNGRGSKDNPIEIPSFDYKRIVACHCEEHSSYVKYTTVYKGEVKRCQCGHWLKCVEPPNFLEKISEEDLMSIPKYRRYKELRAQGIDAKF